MEVRLGPRLARVFGHRSEIRARCFSRRSRRTPGQETSVSAGETRIRPLLRGQCRSIARRPDRRWDQSARPARQAAADARRARPAETRRWTRRGRRRL